MKKLLTLSFLVLLAATNLFAQHAAPKDRKSPHETVTGKHIKVTYGRPYKKGRDIFGGLEPYGKVWRAGADEATEITFDKDCVFGNKRVKAGTYTLFAIPDKNEWTIILNGKLGQWGAFEYDKYKKQDVLHTRVPVTNLSNVTEQFTIYAKDDGLQMEWDKTRVFVPIKY
jgi:hypothetical protein